MRLTNRGGQVHFVTLDRGRYHFSSGEPVRASSACRRSGGGVNVSCPADRVRRILLDLGPGTTRPSSPGPLKPWEEPRPGPRAGPVANDGVADSLEESPAIVEHRFAAFADGRTQLTRLRVRGLPRAASVSIRCSGRGCPFGSRRDERAAPRWSAPRALLRRRLAAGGRVVVTVSAPGRLTKIVHLRMRRQARPARRIYCQGPLSGLVTTCLSASWAPGQGIAP